MARLIGQRIEPTQLSAPRQPSRPWTTNCSKKWHQIAPADPSPHRWIGHHASHACGHSDSASPLRSSNGAAAAFHSPAAAASASASTSLPRSRTSDCGKNTSHSSPPDPTNGSHTTSPGAAARNAPLPASDRTLLLTIFCRYAKRGSTSCWVQVPDESFPCLSAPRQTATAVRRIIDELGHPRSNLCRQIA